MTGGSPDRDDVKVAYVLTQDRGGPVDAALDLAAGMTAVPGWDVRVFGPRPVTLPAALEGRHQLLRVDRKGALRAIGRARRELRRWAPALVHAHDRRAGLVCAGLSRRRGGPRAVVRTVHGVPTDLTDPWFRDGAGPPPSWYSRAVLCGEALLGREATHTIAPVAPLQAFLQERLRIAPVTHIDNGLALPAPLRPPTEVRRLLFVGMLEPVKGVDVLLDALAAPGSPPSLRLTIAGDGPCRAQLRDRARRLGLADRVSFLGFRTDVHALLAACDALVLPSRMEQLGLVLVRAVASGRPVVATDVGGVSTIPGTEGRLVPPDDVAALAAALVGLVADPAPESVRRAASRAHQQFGLERSVREHVALYERLLRAHP